MRLQQNRRPGFTLVELMVAAALTILIMAVLATGFQVGLQSLSILKSAGDQADRLRTVETLLRQDLDAPHFDGGSNPGTLRLSDLRFDRDASLRPAGGFFQIRQPPHPAGYVTLEGIDQDSLSSTRALTHGISMTVQRTGKTPGDLFAAVDPNAGALFAQPANLLDVATVNGTYMTDWAEVHWFLDTTRPTVQNGVLTFPLCRRVRLLTKAPIGGVLPTTTLSEVVSADPTPPPAGNGVTNTLAGIANPTRRLPTVLPPSLPNTSPRYGDDIVITNVVSFEVKPTGVVPGQPGWPRASLSNTMRLINADYPFDDLPTHNLGPAPVPYFQFDTALGGFAGTAFPPTPGAPPILPGRVTGVQIKVRVYDAKNKLTRQSVVTSKL